MIRRTVLATSAAVAASAVTGGVWWAGQARTGPLVGTALPLARRVHFGAYAANEPWPNLDPHYKLERQVGRLQIMSWFQDWGTGWLSPQAANAASTGHDLLIAWDPSRGGQPIPFSDILSGAHDGYLSAYFEGAKKFDGRVVLRPFWEMNGNWAAYSVGRSGGGRSVDSVDQWKAVWRHVVTLQRRVGGANVTFMFCANGNDVGGVAMERYWPGSAFVDRLGLDTYNAGAPWRTPYELISPMYNRLAGLPTSVPIGIGEIGCAEDPEDADRKAQWLGQLFTETDFPRLTSLCFFNTVQQSDWRLNSSAPALKESRSYL